MNTELRRGFHNILTEFLKERSVILEKISSVIEYPEKEQDKKQIEEMDKVISNLLFVLKEF